jgi:hypothetical protein
VVSRDLSNRATYIFLSLFCSFCLPQPPPTNLPTRNRYRGDILFPYLERLTTPGQTPHSQAIMRFPQIFDQALKLLVFLTAYSPVTVSANRGRKDVCGLSMHASDFPNIGSFSVIEATWTVPEVARKAEFEKEPTPFVWPGVALCCGDGCSTRLFAGIWVSRRGYPIPNPTVSGVEEPYTAEPVYQLSPQFDAETLYGEHKLRMSTSFMYHYRPRYSLICNASRAQRFGHSLDPAGAAVTNTSTIVSPVHLPSTGATLQAD